MLAVGFKGSNQAEDVRAAVALFKAIPPSSGGFWGLPPQPALASAERGICSGKEDDFFVGVIGRFQGKWQSDIGKEYDLTWGTLFPKSLTMNKLKQLASMASERTTFPDWLKRVYRLIPMVETWRLAAEKVLVQAKAGITSGTPTEQQKLAMRLVDRVFKITTHPGQTTEMTKADLDRIKAVFDQIKLLIQAISGGALYLLESKEPGHDKDNAYTVPGHWKNKDPNDGIWYVKANIEGATDEFIVDATMHEFAHFCGPSGAGAVDHAHVGGKPAYGMLALGLSKTDALINASSYAWLAYLARMTPDRWLSAT
jgi:hypothetical protein